MAKPNTTLALATFTAPELKADSKQLVLLQKGVVEQLQVMRRLRGEEAMRGLLVGLTLLRIKASLPNGQFTGWLKKNVTFFSDRYCRYLMQLSLVFVERTKVAKPELLALPGDQTELALESKEGAQRRLFEKAAKFIGELSITELLEKHGLKETKKLGGKRDSAPEPETPRTPEELAQQTREELAQQTRDEIGAAVQALEQLLITENRLQYVVGDADFIQGTVESLELLSTKTAELAKQLTKAAKPAKAA